MGPLSGPLGSHESPPVLWLDGMCNQKQNKIILVHHLSGIKRVEASGSAPVSKECDKSEQLRALCWTLSRYRLNRPPPPMWQVLVQLQFWSRTSSCAASQGGLTQPQPLLRPVLLPCSCHLATRRTGVWFIINHCFYVKLPMPCALPSLRGAIIELDDSSCIVLSNVWSVVNC